MLPFSVELLGFLEAPAVVRRYRLVGTALRTVVRLTLPQGQTTV